MALEGEVDVGAFRASGRRGSRHGAPVMDSAGVRMARGTPAVRNHHGGRGSPEAGLGGIPARAGSDVGDGGLGEVLGAQARFPR